MNKVSVFLDTSVWIAGILSNRGASSAVLDLALKHEIEVMSSPDVFEEAQRNLSEKYPMSLEYFINLFHSIYPRLVEPDKEEILIAAKLINADDALILAAAMIARPDFLLTLDQRHFIKSKIVTATDLQILLPSEFLTTHRLRYV